MRVACLMMQKNETLLLEPWIRYHGELFGYDSLFIFDNGSDERALEQLAHLSKLYPINVDLTHNSAGDFERKGDIICQKMKALEGSNNFDFFIPLDCDEFVCAQLQDGSWSCEAEKIFKALSAHERSRDALVIPACFYNIPKRDDFYYFLTVEKTFFATGAAGTLDVGFHNGTSRLSPIRTNTSIILAHFHNKPFEILKAHATQKLKARVSDFNETTLREYKGMGSHLVRYFFMTEAEYEVSFPNKSARFFPDLRERMAQLGVSLNY